MSFNINLLLLTVTLYVFEPPPISPQEEPLYPSNLSSVVLNLNIPAVVLPGLCNVVPEATFILPVPLIVISPVVVNVVNVGLFANTNEPEPVWSLIIVANSAEVVADKALILSVVYIPFVTNPAVNPVAVPVQFDKSPEAGVPNTGVTNVGLFANTNEPEPVSSLILVANSAEVVSDKALILSVV